MTTKLIKLKLDNIAGFKEFELDFHENLTVLIGRNGSGKTTLLRSIALLFDMALDTLLEFVNNPFLNKENWENLAYQKLTKPAARFLLSNSHDAHISLDLCLDGKTLSFKHHHLPVDDFYHLLEDLYNHQQSLPLFVHYPASHAPVGQIEFSDLKLENSPFSAYISACQENVFDFERFFAWFKWQENINREVGSNKKYEVIRQSVCEVISDEQNTFDNLHVTWQQNPNGDLCIEKNGIRLNINQLSAGEKMLMILVADLARRLIIANPNSNHPLQQEGVVLIDEIDLHLHPSWQRAIVPNLMKIFSNCQFIMTTHSPQIISHVKPESIFLLKENGVSHPAESYGKNTDRILEDLMDTDARPPKEKQRLHELFVLIQANKLVQAKELMDELQTEIGMDSELVKAKVLLKRMEIIGK